MLGCIYLNEKAHTSMHYLAAYEFCWNLDAVLLEIKSEEQLAFLYQLLGIKVLSPWISSLLYIFQVLMVLTPIGLGQQTFFMKGSGRGHIQDSLLVLSFGMLVSLVVILSVIVLM